MYPAVPSTILLPRQVVFNEVQMVSTSIAPKTNAVQLVNFTLPQTTTTYSFIISAYGHTATTVLTDVSPPQLIAQVIQQVLPNVTTPPTVSSWVSSTSGTPSRWFSVTFNNTAGPVDPLVITVTTPLGASAAVTTTQAGTEPMDGSFTLSFNGSSTIDMPSDVSAADMKACLEDLPGVGTVTVVRSANYIAGLDRGAYSWAISFTSLAGDLPLLVATSGRLTPSTSGATISVVEVTTGTTAYLLHDGTGIPDVRSVVVPSVIPGAFYSFQVMPLNALGLGVLSEASAPVMAASGASAAQTTTSGSSLAKGITAVVDEQQIITTLNCGAGNQFHLAYGTSSAVFNASADGPTLAGVLESVGVAGASVDKMIDGSNSVSWRVLFPAAGDVSLLSVSNANPFSSSRVVAVEEFVKGNTNQFTIEPKVASGAVLRDIPTAPGSLGQDIFFTESFLNGAWYRDHGIASYNPVVYEVQQVFIPAVVSSVQFSLPDYLTPYSGQVFQTAVVNATSTAESVQWAIQALANVDSVEVSTFASTAGVTFLVTFVSNLCDVPLLDPSDARVVVAELVAGSCEIQMVTLASDVVFTPEVQQFSIVPELGAILITLYGKSVTISVPVTSQAIQAQLNSIMGPNGAPLDVVVTYATLDKTFSVEFTSPVGNVALMVVSQGGKNVNVIEAVPGYSPVSGTFTIAYEGQYTRDISFDASAVGVKAALEGLSNIGVVGVNTNYNANGFQWTISFTQNVGNLRLLQASPIRYEVQSLQTRGGSPTPLSGILSLSYGNDVAIVNYDASADEIAAALESMASVGSVEVTLQSSPSPSSSGPSTWLITFRSLTGNIGLLNVESTNLFGSNASAVVTEVVAGSDATLIGANPRLGVGEASAGKPDYTGQYVVDLPGNYSLRVSQLLPGGLDAAYFDNQRFSGLPSIERVDPTIDFDWSTGLVTLVSTDYVSVRWTGKFMVTKSEMYTIYLTADDGANLYLNHSLLINGSDVCCVEHRAQIFLAAGVYYDVVLEYQEFTGTASVSLKYSSASVRKQIIPSSAFFSAQNIVGSPFSTAVIPGGADYPYTTAYGGGLSGAVTGSFLFLYLLLFIDM